MLNSRLHVKISSFLEVCWHFSKTDTANLLDEYASKIIEGFISSRFDSLQYENCGMYIMKIMEPILQLMEQTFNAVQITFNSLWLKSSLVNAFCCCHSQDYANFWQQWRIARRIWCRTFSSCLAVDECDRVVGLHSEVLLMMIIILHFVVCLAALKFHVEISSFLTVGCQ
nr:hypothetical protein CFP56_48133 [Quercus suber]